MPSGTLGAAAGRPLASQSGRRSELRIAQASSSKALLMAASLRWVMAP